MKFYVASGMGNQEIVKEVIELLEAHGWSCTYDWTDEDNQRKASKQLAWDEYFGVKSADIVIVLLPGNRGCHTELGMAIGYEKKIYLCANDESVFKDCPFYHLEVYNLRRLTGSVMKCLAEVIK